MLRTVSTPRHNGSRAGRRGRGGRCAACVRAARDGSLFRFDSACMVGNGLVIHALLTNSVMDFAHPGFPCLLLSEKKLVA